MGAKKSKIEDQQLYEKNDEDVEKESQKEIEIPSDVINNKIIFYGNHNFGNNISNNSK